MAGLTVDDFTPNVSYREIFGLGEARGEARCQTQEAANVTLRLLKHRWGPMGETTTPKPAAR